jgi:hypothetical protein
MTDDQVSTEPTPDASIPISTQLPDERQTEANLQNRGRKFKNPVLNKYIPSRVWGIHSPGGINKFPNPVDEVADIHAIAYDWKRKAIIQRTTKKRRITLDCSILITTEENLINTEHAKTSELIGVGMVITDATLDRAKRDEEELVASLKELEHLCHLVKYYQDTTQAAVYLRSEFKEAYNKFTDERHLFTARIFELQEDTLMALATCKDMERWYEKVQQAMERIEYISAVQKGRDAEEHDIWVLMESSVDRIRKSTEYWVKMSQEPHREIQEKWAKCEKNWIKINRVMKDIRLPEFGTPDDFVDLRDIVKSHVEQDSSWAEEIAKVTDTMPGQVRQFMEHPIKSRAMLQQLSTSIVKYRVQAVEIREVYSAPMEQHRFPYANTCEDLFIKWSEYEKSHPLK